MAKIRVKQGNNEIEIDSRDFYVDNDTAEEVIEALKELMKNKPGHNVINSLEDAEFHEPEFSQPVTVTVDDIKSCLLYTSPSPRDRTRSRMPSSA